MENNFPKLIIFLRIIEVLNLSLSDFGAKISKNNNQIQDELLKWYTVQMI